MTIYISSNMYKPEELEMIFSLLDKIGDPSVGIELFPDWKSQAFCRGLSEHLERFREYPSALHGPYYDTEHSKAAGTEEYARSMDYFRRTLELSQELKSHYIVYHHNNCRVEPEHREEMIKTATENLSTLRGEAERAGVKIVVENAGVISLGNMLFDESRFIKMAGSIPEGVLLDVGHAHANGWDLQRVIQALAPKITGYHMHNNDGCHDKHNRIFDGTLDFTLVMDCFKRYTPQADITVEYGRQCAGDIEGIAEDVAYIKKALK